MTIEIFSGLAEDRRSRRLRNRLVVNSEALDGKTTTAARALALLPQILSAGRSSVLPAAPTVRRLSAWRKHEFGLCRVDS